MASLRRGRQPARRYRPWRPPRAAATNRPGPSTARPRSQRARSATPTPAGQPTIRTGRPQRVRCGSGCLPASAGMYTRSRSAWPRSAPGTTRCGSCRPPPSTGSCRTAGGSRATPMRPPPAMTASTRSNSTSVKAACVVGWAEQTAGPVGLRSRLSGRRAPPACGDLDPPCLPSHDGNSWPYRLAAGAVRTKRPDVVGVGVVVARAGVLVVVAPGVRRHLVLQVRAVPLLRVCQVGRRPPQGIQPWAVVGRLPTSQLVLPTAAS